MSTYQFPKATLTHQVLKVVILPVILQVTIVLVVLGQSAALVLLGVRHRPAGETSLLQALVKALCQSDSGALTGV